MSPSSTKMTSTFDHIFYGGVGYLLLNLSYGILTKDLPFLLSSSSSSSDSTSSSTTKTKAVRYYTQRKSFPLYKIVPLACTSTVVGTLANLVRSFDGGFVASSVAILALGCGTIKSNVVYIIKPSIGLKSSKKKEEDEEEEDEGRDEEEFVETSLKHIFKGHLIACTTLTAMAACYRSKF